MNSLNKKTIMNYQFVLNGIVTSYQKLINSTSLIQDLVDVNQNYECFLINHFKNSKLSKNSLNNESEFLYNIEESLKLINDKSYCENWLEIIKSYLFSIGIDVEDKESDMVFDQEALEKSVEKLTTVIASLKLVMMLTTIMVKNDNFNKKFIDNITDIYLIVFKAYLKSNPESLEKYFYDLEDSKIGTPLQLEYQKFCELNFKENAFKGIFGDLEDQIIVNFNIDQSQNENSVNALASKDSSKITQSQTNNPNINQVLQLGIIELVQSQKTNNKANFNYLITVFEDSVIANDFSEQLLESIDSNYKNNFLQFVNLYLLNNRIINNDKLSDNSTSAINSDEISKLISSLKLLASFFKERDNNFYQNISQIYKIIYSKFSQIGELDGNNDLSYFFYANEMPNNTKAGIYYNTKSPNGIFIEIEEEFDQQRLSKIIDENIKKFDAKTLKFYQSPYLDFRLENIEKENYSIQVVFDGDKISFDQVAKDFNVKPEEIINSQKKILNEGSAISFTHKQVANYLQIREGEELNQTLLTIHNLAQEESKNFQQQVEAKSNFNENPINLNNQKKSYPEDVVSRDFEDQINESYDQQFVSQNQSNIKQENYQAIKEDYQEKNLSPKNQTNNDFDKSEFFAMYNFYIENKDKISNAINDSSIKQALFFLALNPDLKLGTTSNPKLDGQVRNQLKFYFKKGYNQNNLKLFATFIARGELKDWQISDDQEAKAKGFEGSYILPHDFSGQFLGVRNPNEYNSAIAKLGEIFSNEKILNMAMIDFLYQDDAYNILKNLIAQDFKLSFEYFDEENIFTPKNLILIADNGQEREKIYNYLGLTIDNTKIGSEHEILNIRNQITNSNGDVVIKEQIASFLFSVKSIQEADLMVRKIESFIIANQDLCKSFNVNQQKNLRILLNLVEQDNDEENIDEELDEDENQNYAVA
jgi:hypothetical protein